MAALLNLEDPVVSSFLFYATVVILKTMFMSFSTAYHRLTKNIFINPEDSASASNRTGKKIPIVTNHPDVERVRRCHQNDLENVIPFVLIGLLYTMTSPDPYIAKLHFRFFTGARFFHTLAYLFPLPQPSRALGFFVGVAATISMAVSVLNKATF